MRPADPSVFATTVDGRTVYSSVSVVTIVDEADRGRRCGSSPTSDGTGNVNDLVREGVVKVDGLKTG